jgi:hypothetical protein
VASPTPSDCVVVTLINLEESATLTFISTLKEVTFELSKKFDFQPLTSKPDNKVHPRKPANLTFWLDLKVVYHLMKINNDIIE